MSNYFKVYVKEINVYYEIALEQVGCRVQTRSEPCNMYFCFCSEEVLDKVREFDWVTTITEYTNMFKWVNHS